VICGHKKRLATRRGGWKDRFHRQYGVLCIVQDQITGLIGQLTQFLSMRGNGAENKKAWLYNQSCQGFVTMGRIVIMLIRINTLPEMWY
jgi:hypothetical protein